MTAAIRASVVVPVHGRAGLTERCLRLLLADLPAGCEAIVVDDASEDRTPRMLDGFGEAIRALRLERNAGFAGACNAGAALARGEHLVFLNNDTEPQSGWLAALLDCAEAHPEAAVVGAKLLHPVGTVQHAGVVFGQDGYPHNLYAGFPAGHPAPNRKRRLQAVTGACMLVRREAFERVGGFDEGFLNSMEDVDLCLRLGEAGREVRYTPAAVVTHLESATRGTGDFEPSVARYRERWRARVYRDDLEIYAADGLIEVEYPSAHPLRISVSPLLASVERSDGHEGELEPLLRAQGRRSADLGRELTRLSAELADRGIEVEPAALDYERVVAAVREQVERTLPEGARALVVSRGDAELLRARGRECLHFPRGADGRYLGRHPADEEEAIALLEAERAVGAEYLVVPAAEAWWLEHYRGLAAHLADRASGERHESCAIYALGPSPVPTEASR
ncbi:MAG TPA: glycosyltransferase family 2 protein [Solirubrobacterales bacterium]|jgi:GT2 family glycosyltransferase|nr:glycosyltransferase family 2 protein [Solirubrobacterales bacterium]